MHHRHRPVALVGAPSSIGIRPYDTGEARHLDRAPGVLRELGLVERLSAADLGDVVPPPYEDFVRPPGRARNEAGVVSYSLALAERVSIATRDRRFTLVLGGDCSILLGALLGAKDGSGAAIGLAYVDAHADFATPEESSTGSVASMDLALAVGRGDTPLARLGGDAPLVRAHDAVLLGRRDAHESWYGHNALRTSGVLDIPDHEMQRLGAGEVARWALDRLARPELGGFWIHVDADVLNPLEMPAVDSPEPGGFGVDALSALLTPLVQHPKALGLQLTIYDPALDPERSCAARLVKLLEALSKAGEDVQ